ncbi:MAG TPA: DUF6580 family putative transport protein [Rhizomicrobium sp.]|jgi:hypothetical protein
MKPRLTLVILMVIAAAASRLIPHPPNMTSVTAIALFGGATLADRRLAFLVPLAALFLSDLVLGFHDQMAVVYGCFVAVTGIGLWLQSRRSPLFIAGAALASSVLFFAVTNFGVWAMDAMYPRTLQGLIACYTAAIPFFRNTLEGDLLYTLVLFGGFALLERRYPALRSEAALPAAA